MLLQHVKLLPLKFLFHVSSQASSRLYWRIRSRGKPVIDKLSNNHHQARKQRRETKSQPRKKDKYFILSLFIMTEDSATLSLDLANNFPEAEESQI